MNQVILVLLILAAVAFVVGGLSRFFKFEVLGHEATVWWRGAMGFLGFAVALMIWQILQILSKR